MDYNRLPKKVLKYTLLCGDKLATIHNEIIGSLNNKCTSDDYTRHYIEITCVDESTNDRAVVAVTCIGRRTGEQPGLPQELLNARSCDEELHADDSFDSEGPNDDSFDSEGPNDDSFDSEEFEANNAYRSQRPLNKNASIYDGYQRSLDAYYDQPMEFVKFTYSVIGKNTSDAFDLSYGEITVEQFTSLLDKCKVTTDIIKSKPQSVIVDNDAIDFNVIIGAIYDKLSIRDTDHEFRVDHREITSINGTKVFMSIDSMNCMNSVESFINGQYDAEYMNNCNMMFELYLQKIES